MGPACMERCTLKAAKIEKSTNRSSIASCACTGTVLKLGTKVHHDQLLKGIDSLDAVGCFALTELGYGMYNHTPTQLFLVNVPLTCCLPLSIT